MVRINQRFRRLQQQKSDDAGPEYQANLDLAGVHSHAKLVVEAFIHASAHTSPLNGLETQGIGVGFRLLLSIAPAASCCSLAAVVASSGAFPPVRWEVVASRKEGKPLSLTVVPAYDTYQTPAGLVGSWLHRDWMFPAELFAERRDVRVPLFAKIAAVYIYSYEEKYILDSQNSLAMAAALTLGSQGAAAAGTVGSRSSEPSTASAVPAARRWKFAGYSYGGCVATVCVLLMPVSLVDALVTFGSPPTLSHPHGLFPFPYTNVQHLLDLTPHLFSLAQMSKNVARLRGLGYLIPRPPKVAELNRLVVGGGGGSTAGGGRGSNFVASNSGGSSSLTGGNFVAEKYKEVYLHAQNHVAILHPTAAQLQEFRSSTANSTSSGGAGGGAHAGMITRLAGAGGGGGGGAASRNPHLHTPKLTFDNQIAPYDLRNQSLDITMLDFLLPLRALLKKAAPEQLPKLEAAPGADTLSLFVSQTGDMNSRRAAVDLANASLWVSLYQPAPSGGAPPGSTVLGALAVYSQRYPGAKEGGTHNTSPRTLFSVESTEPLSGKTSPAPLIPVTSASSSMTESTRGAFRKDPNKNEAAAASPTAASSPSAAEMGAGSAASTVAHAVTEKSIAAEVVSMMEHMALRYPRICALLRDPPPSMPRFGLDHFPDESFALAMPDALAVGNTDGKPGRCRDTSRRSQSPSYPSGPSLSLLGDHVPAPQRFAIHRSTVAQTAAMSQTVGPVAAANVATLLTLLHGCLSGTMMSSSSSVHSSSLLEHSALLEISGEHPLATEQYLKLLRNYVPSWNFSRVARQLHLWCNGGPLRPWVCLCFVRGLIGAWNLVTVPRKPAAIPPPPPMVTALAAPRPSIVVAEAAASSATRHHIVSTPLVIESLPNADLQDSAMHDPQNGFHYHWCVGVASTCHHVGKSTLITQLTSEPLKSSFGCHSMGATSGALLVKGPQREAAPTAAGALMSDEGDSAAASRHHPLAKLLRERQQGGATAFPNHGGRNEMRLKWAPHIIADDFWTGGGGPGSTTDKKSAAMQAAAASSPSDQAGNDLGAAADAIDFTKDDEEGGGIAGGGGEKSPSSHAGKAKPTGGKTGKTSPTRKKSTTTITAKAAPDASAAPPPPARAASQVLLEDGPFGTDGVESDGMAQRPLLVKLDVVEIFDDGSPSSRSLLEQCAQVLWVVQDAFSVDHLLNNADFQSASAAQQCVVYVPRQNIATTPSASNGGNPPLLLAQPAATSKRSDSPPPSLSQTTTGGAAGLPWLLYQVLYHAPPTTADLRRFFVTQCDLRVHANSLAEAATALNPISLLQRQLLNWMCPNLCGASGVDPQGLPFGVDMGDLLLRDPTALQSIVDRHLATSHFASPNHAKGADSKRRDHPHDKFGTGATDSAHPSHD